MCKFFAEASVGSHNATLKGMHADPAADNHPLWKRFNQQIGACGACSAQSSWYGCLDNIANIPTLR
jgi:hypothetical protein